MLPIDAKQRQNVNLIIPMAGAGQRFRDAGYTAPKPFIRLSSGSTMIEEVVQNLTSSRLKSITLITQKAFLTDEYVQILKKIEYSIKLMGREFNLFTVDSLTEGPACTALIAKDIIDSDNPCYIVNSDQLVLDVGSALHSSIEFFNSRQADGGIPCFLNDHPKWSYAKYQGGRVVEVAEKKVISNLATIGWYYFKSGKTFVELVNRMMKDNLRVNNEFYIAPAYNYMIHDGGLVLPYLVNNMVGLGTPEDLELYEKGIA